MKYFFSKRSTNGVPLNSTFWLFFPQCWTVVQLHEQLVLDLFVLAFIWTLWEWTQTSPILLSCLLLGWDNIIRHWVQEEVRVSALYFYAVCLCAYVTRVCLSLLRTCTSLYLFVTRSTSESVASYVNIVLINSLRRKTKCLSNLFTSDSNGHGKLW